MSEYKVFENDEVVELVLKYADKKYTHTLMKIQDPDVCPNSIWSMHESLESAREQQVSETEAYDSPEWMFLVCEVKRTETKLLSGRISTFSYLHMV